MSDPSSRTLTQLLHQWREGDEAALQQLMPLVYDELRRLAGHYMKSERSSHTLQATALVNEAYIRLVDMDVPWQDRAHFFAIAARLLRRILVDHAKALNRSKRGAGQILFTLDESLLPPIERGIQIIALDDALQSLASLNERKAQIIELHYFGGLSYDEMAEALGISTATVHRELKLAKAWLHSELKKKDASQ
ncbi:sigma-70 family RNA polymerase sigma factor [bacterium]|nr:sigma-70 family RNA polymerase sigma factor [bacterium]